MIGWSVAAPPTTSLASATIRGALDPRASAHARIHVNRSSFAPATNLWERPHCLKPVLLVSPSGATSVADERTRLSGLCGALCSGPLPLSQVRGGLLNLESAPFQPANSLRLSTACINEGLGLSTQALGGARARTGAGTPVEELSRGSSASLLFASDVSWKRHFSQGRWWHRLAPYTCKCAC